MGHVVTSTVSSLSISDGLRLMVGLHPGRLPGRPELVRSVSGTVLGILMPLFSALSFLLARESRSLSPARAARSSCSSLVRSSSEALSPASVETMPASCSAASSDPSVMPASRPASPRDLSAMPSDPSVMPGQPPATVAFRIRARPVGGRAPVLRHEPTIVTVQPPSADDGDQERLWSNLAPKPAVFKNGVNGYLRSKKISPLILNTSSANCCRRVCPTIS